MARFTDIFQDVTKDGYKIPKEKYLPQGRYPIIDQGQEYIAGYSNESAGLYENVPAIIFGDHTRIIKYVDTPCFLGADGVKLLRAKAPDSNYKYLYYALTYAQIPNTGYNRHFKWLKEVDIRIPDPNEQQHIVKILDKLSGLISLRKQQLAKLDELVKSRFVEMFGDPLSNDKQWEICGWDKVFNTTTGKLDSNAAVVDGEYPFFTCAKEWLWIDKYAFDCEALLLAGNNAAGVYDVKHYSGKFNAYQRTYVLTLINDSWQYVLFKYQLENRLAYLQNQSKGTNTRYLTLGILYTLDFIVPPIELQCKFSRFTQQVDKQKLTIQQSLDKLEVLKKSLMQEYFG